MTVQEFLRSTRRSGVTFGLIGSLLLLASQPASAVTIMTSGFGENDCSGFFGTGFGSCQIVGDTTLSPVIAKFGEGLNFEESNPLYPSIDGSEWSFSNTGASNSTGDWSYSPTGADPGIRFWAAKAGRDFKLFWEVSDADAAGVCAGQGDFGTTGLIGACLDAAMVVTSGSWSTPGLKALSHLSFYDTAPPVKVAEPATLGLLGLGLLGIGFARRRRS